MMMGVQGRNERRDVWVRLPVRGLSCATYTRRGSVWVRLPVRGLRLSCATLCVGRCAPLDKMAC
jgi:hypothetical protein